MTLTFACPAAQADLWLPRFERMIDSVVLARRPRGEKTLGDRLWGPLVTGGIVGIVLLLLYRHTRRRPRDKQPETSRG